MKDPTTYPRSVQDLDWIHSQRVSYEMFVQAFV